MDGRVAAAAEASAHAGTPARPGSSAAGTPRGPALWTAAAPPGANELGEVQRVLADALARHPRRIGRAGTGPLFGPSAPHTPRAPAPPSPLAGWLPWSSPGGAREHGCLATAREVALSLLLSPSLSFLLSPSRSLHLSRSLSLSLSLSLSPGLIARRALSQVVDLLSETATGSATPPDADHAAVHAVLVEVPPRPPLKRLALRPKRAVAPGDAPRATASVKRPRL